MIVFRRVRSADAHPILLEWVGLAGGVKQWLFSADNVATSSVKFNQISNINSFRGIPQNNKKEIALVTFSLSEDEYDYVKDLQFTNLVTVTNNGQTLPGSLTNIKVTEPNPEKLRDFSLKIMLQGVLQMNN